MKKGALYKHYKNKRDISNKFFEHVCQLDSERSQKAGITNNDFDGTTEAFTNTSIKSVKAFIEPQFRYSSRKREVEEIAAGIDIIITSGMEADGYVAVLPYLKEGKTAALLGSSGVGKSTLINRLLGEDILETNGLRDDDKGRHTTTHRELK